MIVTHREREAETQAEEEAGSMQGARCGIRSGVSRIAPWAEGGAKPLSHLGCHIFTLITETITEIFLPLKGRVKVMGRVDQ